MCYIQTKTTTLVLKTTYGKTYVDYEIKDAFIEENTRQVGPEDDIPIFNTINEGLDY